MEEVGILPSAMSQPKRHATVWGEIGSAAAPIVEEGSLSPSGEIGTLASERTDCVRLLLDPLTDDFYAMVRSGQDVNEVLSHNVIRKHQRRRFGRFKRRRETPQPMAPAKRTTILPADMGLAIGEFLLPDQRKHAGKAGLPGIKYLTLTLKPQMFAAHLSQVIQQNKQHTYHMIDVEAQGHELPRNTGNLNVPLDATRFEQLGVVRLTLPVLERYVPIHDHMMELLQRTPSLRPGVCFAIEPCIREVVLRGPGTEGMTVVNDVLNTLMQRRNSTVKKIVLPFQLENQG